MEGGEPTFDVLVVPKPVPESGTIELIGGWGRPPRRRAPVDELHLDRVYDYPTGSVYIYTTAECSVGP